MNVTLILFISLFTQPTMMIGGDEIEDGIVEQLFIQFMCSSIYLFVC